jgi:NAD(P)-dependent dehydrogenase (short-subunit alcohol dehydrogenase family)
LKIEGYVALVTGANRGLDRAYGRARVERGVHHCWSAGRRLTVRTTAPNEEDNT